MTVLRSLLSGVLHTPGSALRLFWLGLGALACNSPQDIVEPPPISGVVTGRVTDTSGQGIGQAVVTIRIDEASSPGLTDLSDYTLVTGADGTFSKTVLVGGHAELDAVAHVAATPPAGSLLQPDSVSGPLRLKTPEPFDTLTVTIALSAN